MARRFLAEAGIGDGMAAQDLTAADVTGFARRECSRRGVASAKATVTGLRALLRFLFLDGQVTAPLAGAVPSAACWQLAALPRGVSPADLARIIGSCDRRGVAGRRDYAVILLLARPGRTGTVHLHDCLCRPPTGPRWRRRRWPARPVAQVAFQGGIRASATYVDSVAWSKDGSRLVTAGYDGTVRLYDASTGQQIGTSLPAPGANFPYATFSPDGRIILVTDVTGQVWLYSATTVGWVAYACRVANRELTRAEWSKFVSGHPYQPVCRR